MNFGQESTTVLLILFNAKLREAIQLLDGGEAIVELGQCGKRGPFDSFKK